MGGAGAASVGTRGQRRGGAATTRSWWFEACVVVLGLAATSNSLDNPFVLDDIVKVKENPDIQQPLSELHNRLVYPYRQATDGSWELRRNDPSRPATFATYSLNYALAGPAPWAFRLTNLLLHVANAFVLRRLMCRLASGMDPAGAVRDAPEVVGLLFLVSPLNVGTATYVYARSELMSTLFGLLSLESSLSTRPLPLAPAAWHLAALASKQTALVVPPLALVLRSFHPSPALSSPSSPSSRSLYALYALTTFLYLAARMQVPAPRTPPRRPLPRADLSAGPLGRCWEGWETWRQAVRVSTRLYPTPWCSPGCASATPLC